MSDRPDLRGIAPTALRPVQSHRAAPIPKAVFSRWEGLTRLARSQSTVPPIRFAIGLNRHLAGCRHRCTCSKSPLRLSANRTVACRCNSLPSEIATTASKTALLSPTGGVVKYTQSKHHFSQPRLQGSTTARLRTSYPARGSRPQNQDGTRNADLTRTRTPPYRA
jgi:hypothetical protein